MDTLQQKQFHQLVLKSSFNPKYIRENLESFKLSTQKRWKNIDFDRFIQLDEKRRQEIKIIENYTAELHKSSKQVEFSKIKIRQLRKKILLEDVNKDDERAFFEKIEKSFSSVNISPENIFELEKMLKIELNTADDQEIKNISQSVKDFLQQHSEMKKILSRRQESEAIQKKLDETNRQLGDFLTELPNILDTQVPKGKNEDDNKEIKRVGDHPTFSFRPKAHFEIANTHHLDFGRASKISGARFSLMYGKMAKLERALINFFLDENKKRGYEEISHPTLVNGESLFSTGQLPKFEEDLFSLGGEYQHFFLTPTSEVPLTNIYRNEKIDKTLMPFHFCAVSHCYRSEAGAAGRDTKGLMRLHEFKKVELVKITLPEESENEHQKMLQDVENLLQKLELPYRIMLLCSGDTGFSAAKCYDFEAWIPSEKKYREISSCSNCQDFQARRANMRLQSKDKSLTFPHTLNGSALAVGRTMIALLENHQQADHCVRIPKALQSYLDGEEFIHFDTAPSK